jgi:creatinine amidohydrolase/Fe(II)-dependent formamide hydrolase-like protein
MNLLAEMSWEETKAYLARDDRIILPLGSTEQHGPHLGLGVVNGHGGNEAALVSAVQQLAAELPQLRVKNFQMNLHLFPQKYPDGIMGLNPANATREVGEALLEKSAEICAREVEEW